MDTEFQSVEADQSDLSDVVYARNTESKSRGVPNTLKSSVKWRKKQNNKNKRVLHKFTLMFMLITVIFLICYIPKVIIMLLEVRNTAFWEEFSDSTRGSMLFVYRMYIINNIINPIIYAFLDNGFSREIRKLYGIYTMNLNRFLNM